MAGSSIGGFFKKTNYLQALNWSFDSYMIINPDRCKYMCMGKNSNVNDTLSLNEFNWKNTDEEIIQGTTNGQKLTFNIDIKNSSKRTGQILW